MASSGAASEFIRRLHHAKAATEFISLLTELLAFLNEPPAAAAATNERWLRFVRDSYTEFTTALLWDNQHTINTPPASTSAPSASVTASASTSAGGGGGVAVRRNISWFGEWSNGVSAAERAALIDVWFIPSAHLPASVIVIALATALNASIVEFGRNPTHVKVRHATVMEYAAERLAAWTNLTLLPPALPAVPAAAAVTAASSTPAPATPAASAATGLLPPHALWLQFEADLATAAKPPASVDAKSTLANSGSGSSGGYVIPDSVLRTIDIIGSLPDRMSNVFARNTPLQWKPHYFFGLVLDHALTALDTRIAAAPSGTDKLCLLTSTVIGKLSRLGHSGVAVDRFVPRIRTAIEAIGSSAVARTRVAVYRTVLMRVPANALDAVLERMLRALAIVETERAANAQLLTELFAPALLPAAEAASRDDAAGAALIKFVLTHKFMLVKVLPLSTLQLLIAVFQSVSSTRRTPELPLIDDALSRLARVWADPQFIRHSHWDQHYYISHALILCLRALQLQHRLHAKSASDSPPVPPALSELMSGVQHRLSNPVTKIRRIGMRVAEEFSRVMDPANPLRFDDDAAAAGAADAADADESERARAESAQQKATEADVAESTAAAAALTTTGVNDSAAAAVHPIRRQVGFTVAGQSKPPASNDTRAWGGLKSEAVSSSSAQPPPSGSSKVLIETVDDDDAASFTTPAAAASTARRAAAAAVTTTASAAATKPPPPAVEDDLKPYSLADAQTDLAPVKPPRYLREVIDYLRVRESDTHHRDYIRAALKASERLIRARPEDLDEVSIELLSTLFWCGTLLSSMASGGRSKATAAAAAAGVDDPDASGGLAALQKAAAAMMAAADEKKTDDPAMADGGGGDEDSEAVEWRHRAMVAVCVFCTEAAIPFCVRSFFSDNQTITSRIDLLDVLEDTARELSALPAAKAKPQPAAAATPAAAKPKTKADSKSEPAPAPAAAAAATASARNQLDVVRERVEKTTRRWGSLARKSVEPIATANRFAPHARLFFFGLIRGMEAPRTGSSTIVDPFMLDSSTAASAATVDDSASSRGGAQLVWNEPLLLSRVLYCAGLFIQCSGFGADTPVLAKQLLQLVFVTRLHAQASVRRSSVYAVSRVFATLSEAVLFTHIGTDLPDLIEWLIDTHRTDADSETKRLAAHCLLALKSLLGDTNPLLAGVNPNSTGGGGGSTSAVSGIASVLTIPSISASAPKLLSLNPSRSTLKFL